MCGRRWGKTVAGLTAAVAGHGPGYSRPGAMQGGKIWWVAPSNPISADLWRELKRATRDCWTDKDEQERRIELPGGGSIAVKSAERPEALVGIGLDGLVIDEAARVKSEVFYESLRPTLSDRLGWMIAISTPRGFNWFYDLFLHAQTTPDWGAWQRPTSDNPIIPASEIESARVDSPRFFGQEYLASFEQPEGAEWDPRYFPDSIWFSEWPKEPVISCMAIDPSLGKGEKRHGCYAAIVYGALDSRGVCWCECWASQDWDGGRLAEKAVELAERLRPTCVLCEANGGQEFLGFLLTKLAHERGFGMPLDMVTHSGALSKEDRIRASLTDRFRRQEFRFRDTPATHIMVNQARGFPVEEYMDCIDALSMMADHLLVLLRRRTGTPRR